MKEVKIYGYLSKIFGSSIKIYLSNKSNILDAIDCVKPGFRAKVMELIKQNKFYFINVERDYFEILPCILGSGFFSWVGDLWDGAVDVVQGVKQVVSDVWTTVKENIVHIGQIVLGVALLFVPGGQVYGATLIASGAYGMHKQHQANVEFRRKQQELAEALEKIKNKKYFTGGSSASSSLGAKSYAFNNKLNLSSQGNVVKIGYGEMTLGSFVLNFSLKSFSTQEVFAKNSYI